MWAKTTNSKMNNSQKKSIIFALIIFILQLSVVNWPGLILLGITLIFLAIVASLKIFFKVKYKLKPLLAETRLIFLPLLFNIGGILYIQSLSIVSIKYIVLVAFAVMNYFLFIALKRVSNLGERAAKNQRNLLVSVGILSVFFTLSTLYKLYITNSVNSDIGVPLVLIIFLTGVIFFLVSYFLAWENGINQRKFLPYNVVIALMGMEVAWVSSIWIINYPIYSSYEKASLLGIPLPAIILPIIFYFTWGIVSHKADKSLTKNVIIEYTVFTILFLAILFVSARWLPQV